MAYSELIKNFENVRDYMREFYVYGFKNRSDYTEKSPRSYDDERRRMESWLGKYMSFIRTPEGKNVFISIDSRITGHNPLYKALKAKSFTDKDITLHFILFDLLYSPEISLCLSEILEKTDEYLSEFDTPMVFDESTVRKKLKEYTELGLIVTERAGRRILYHRSSAAMPVGVSNALHFFSETAPVGAVGSFLLDKQGEHKDNFGFKHHYITSALDSDVTAKLFMAMQKKAVVTVTNHSRFSKEPQRKRLIPLRIFMSVQNGRHHLLAYEAEYNSIKAFRIDYLSDVKIEEETPRFDELRAMLDVMQKNMWGVSVRKGLCSDQRTERVEFTVRVEEDEEHIVRRLLREKRIGRIERIDKNNYRFTAEVYDTSELIPWIRTFICRITSLDFANKTLERQFKTDIRQMYGIYGIEVDEK